ncbi:sulfatase-like hydrolase/transferase [Nannocystis radixulma]|uniref:Sulfatase-like hydrolase/transferase n=1 Tax=Nannocystis radixulma TaxID=2995305 RepID=A0ABT5B451_9BACT|nr:sulfatase-like hydrolase/transferase [Nannocystis radixulma]MDC0668866.1 sulfatase-like hydrolase/transferase [Nannocystis radixulma]
MSARALLLAIGLAAGAAGEARAAPAWRLAGHETPTSLAPGQGATVRVELVNLSRETWSEGQKDRLSYHWEDASGAVIVRDGARTRLPFPVAPGQRVAVPATLAAPAAAGRYVLRWALVRENRFWYDPPVGGGDAIEVDVGPAPGTWSIEQVEVPREVAAGARAEARVRLCNTGANTWAAAHGDALSYHWLGREGERLEGVRTPLPAAVEPGGCVVLPAELRAPARPGPYTLQWQPVREGKAWYGPGTGEAATAVAVGPPRDAFAALALSLPPLQAGLPAEAQLTLEHRGEQAWLPGHGLKVSYLWTGPDGHVQEGIRTELPAEVEPGEVVELAFKVRPPDAPGTWLLTPRLVREGEAWIAPEHELAAAATVGPPALAWELVAADWPTRLAAAGSDEFTVTVRNTGAETWSPAAGDRLSYRWRTDDGAPLQHEGMRTELPHPVAPGETATVSVRVAGPPRAGSYALALAMVREQVRWFPPPTGSPSEHVVEVMLRSTRWQLALIAATLAGLVATRRRRPGPGSWRWAALDLVPALWLWAAGVVLTFTFAELAAIELWQGGRAAAFSAAAVPALFVLLMPARARPWLAFVLSLGTAVLLLADLLYMHVLGAIVPVQALVGAHQVGDIGASVKALLRPEYAWLAAAPISGLALAGAWPRARERASKTARRRATLVGLATLVAASLPIAVILGGAMASGLGSRVFSEQHNAGRFGVLGAHLFDVVRTLGGAFGRGSLTPEERAEIAAFFAERAEARPPDFAAARGANLLVIQAEALQGWTIGASVAGQEITPFLNRLRRRALYFRAIVDITAQGMTSDAEYAILNSQYPLGQGAVAFLRAGNQFETIAHALQAAGYSTLSAHPFKRGFWNRATLHPRYGFDRSLFDRELGPGPVIGWGLADEAFFARMLPELAQAKKPFFAFLVTLSLHHPYDEFPPGLRRLQLGALEGTSLGNYLHGIHHLDAALAELFAGLEATGLADSTAVAIYGDHDARLGVTPEIAALAGEPAGSPSLPLRLERVPGFLVLPGGQAGEVDAVGSHVDLAPTWLHYLGIPAPPAFVGRPLVPGRAGPGVAALPDGSAVGDDRLFAVAGRDIPPGGACFAADGARIEREACTPLVQRARRALAVSRAIADHDLARALPSGPDPGP